MSAPQIRIDYRERPSGVPALLEKLGLPTQVCELPVGDYIVGEIAIERKTASDFIGSLTSGHLNNQLYELSSNFNLSYLIVTGNLFAEYVVSNIPKNALISKMIGCSAKCSADGKQGNIITLQLFSDEDLAQAIRFLYDKVQHPEFRLPDLPKFRPSSDDWMTYVLKSLPDIAEVRAKALLTHFGTLEAVFKATAEDLAKVDGISKRRAEKLFTLFHEHYKGD